MLALGNLSSQGLQLSWLGLQWGGVDSPGTHLLFLLPFCPPTLGPKCLCSPHKAQQELGPLCMVWGEQGEDCPGSVLSFCSLQPLPALSLCTQLFLHPPTGWVSIPVVQSLPHTHPSPTAAPSWPTHQGCAPTPQHSRPGVMAQRGMGQMGRGREPWQKTETLRKGSWHPSWCSKLLIVCTQPPWAPAPQLGVGMGWVHQSLLSAAPGRKGLLRKANPAQGHHRHLPHCPPWVLAKPQWWHRAGSSSQRAPTSQLGSLGSASASACLLWPRKGHGGDSATARGAPQLCQPQLNSPETSCPTERWRSALGCLHPPLLQLRTGGRGQGDSERLLHPAPLQHRGGKGTPGPISGFAAI